MTTVISSSYPAARRALGLVSVCFFLPSRFSAGSCICVFLLLLLLLLLLSFFLSATRIAIALTCLDRFSWNLVTRVIDRKGTLGCDQFGVKGHVGVTKVNDIYCVKKLKQGEMEKLNRSSCRPWWKLKSIQLHRCHMTFGFGVKGQNVQKFCFFQKTTSYKQVEQWCCDWHICIHYGQCLWVV